MNLFYIMTALVLSAGFIVGYKTGFIKFFTGVLTTAIAAAISCCCFILLLPQLASWFDFTQDFNIAFTLGLIFLLILVSLLLLVRFLFFRFCVTRYKKINRFLGAMAGTVIFAGILIAVITQNSFIKPPDIVTDQLATSGITNFVTAAKEVITANLPVYKETGEEIILAADNNIKVPAKESNTPLPFLSNTFIVRPDLEAEMLQLVNIERSKAGLHYVTADSLLVYVARKHLADMLIRGYFSHNTPEGYTPFDRLHSAKISYLYAGENLAFAATLIRAHNGLMLSPGHRANILKQQYSKAGIGVLESPLHGLLIAQEFKD